jgi:hypothetical protein
LALPSPPASNTVVINTRCSLRIEADQKALRLTVPPERHEERRVKSFLDRVAARASSFPL